jgi:hypothetical protein
MSVRVLCVEGGCCGCPQLDHCEAVSIADHSQALLHCCMTDAPHCQRWKCLCNSNCEEASVLFWSCITALGVLSPRVLLWPDCCPPPWLYRYFLSEGYPTPLPPPPPPRPGAEGYDAYVAAAAARAEAQVWPAGMSWMLSLAGCLCWWCLADAVTAVKGAYAQSTQPADSVSDTPPGLFAAHVASLLPCCPSDNPTSPSFAGV